MEIVPEKFGAARVESAFWNPKAPESAENGRVTVTLTPHESTGVILK